MDWSQSYTAEWRVFKVNTETWADADTIPNIISITINKSADGDLLESGNMDITGDFETGYYRVAMTAIQGDDIERVDVATLLCVSSSGSEEYGTATRSISGLSVLFPASVSAVTTGEYAPAGINGAEYAANLLRGAINAPVEVEGVFTLNEHVVHDLGASVLEAVWAVLEAGNFVIQIDGRGTVHIRPKPTEPSLILNNDTTNLLMNQVSYSSDISELPNRYVVNAGNILSTLENNDEASPISTVNRGYNVDVIDTSPTLINGETLAAYMRRKLHESSKMKEERRYDREYAPNVYPYSIIRASILSMDGDFEVSNQSISCDNGITVSETAYKGVYLWQ